MSPDTNATDLGASALASACLVAFGAASLAALALPRLARASGWLDRPEGAEKSRKLQRRPVPPVGGAIALSGMLAGWAVLGARGALPGDGLHDLDLSPALGPVGALLVAFAVGLIDDLRPGGLAPGWKLAGQALAGTVLCAPGIGFETATSGALGVALLFALGAVVATNAVNTFDNADGAAGMVMALAALASDPVVAAALVPFLVLNLRRRRDGEVAAYLGDSGSHLLGLWVLITPAAWPVLVLPLADLARLAVVRLASGSRPWRGDRRHLAHRLLRRGVPRLWVPVLLAGIALPTVLFGMRGAPGTLAAFAFALALGDRAPRSGAACPEPGPGG